MASASRSTATARRRQLRHLRGRHDDQRRAAAGRRRRQRCAAMCRTGRSTTASLLLHALRLDHRELAAAGRPGHRRAHAGRTGRRHKGARCRSARRGSARDGRGMFFLSDHGGEFIELRYVDMFNGEQQLLAPQSRWDVERFDTQPGRPLHRLHLNEGGFDRLVLHDLAQQADILLPRAAGGRGDRRAALQSRRQASWRVAGDRAVARRISTCCQRGRDARSAAAGALDAQRARAHRCREAGGRRAVAFPTWDQKDGTAAAARCIRLQAAHTRTASGGHRHPRRARIAVPPRLERLHAIPGQ